jgi:hypothetical protein
MIAGSPFVLRVPIDVSHAPEFAPGCRISVLVWNRQGYHQQRLVTFETQGTVEVTFELERAPESLQVALGPESATPSDLQHLQTAFVTVPPSAWQASAEVTLPAIQVSSWDWWWWQHWRQNFHVTGRVVNAHGSPVAGAAVSAFDVDACWWWTAQEQVGSAVTGGDGSFLIEFTRCCGWRPRSWWATRDWQVDAALMKRITSSVRQHPGLDLPASAANSVPSLEIFQPLLNSRACPLPPNIAATLSQAGKTIDPAELEPIREWLIEILSQPFPLPIWPWSEWAPWEDCGANLIFQVTAMQGDKTAVLLNEGVVSARWDIPALFDVKLLASEPTSCRSSADWTLVDHFFRNASASSQIRNDANPQRVLMGTAASQKMWV